MSTIFYKLDNEDLKLINKAAKITLVDYELKKEFIPTENLFCVIEDLVYELEKIKEEFKQYKDNVNDNYRPIPISEQVGVSDKDFY